MSTSIRPYSFALALAITSAIALGLSPEHAGATSTELLLAPTGVLASDEFGTSVANAGDINGDGYDDIIVGAPRGTSGAFNDNGTASVYLGGPTGDGTVDLLLGGEANFDDFGSVVASAGDVNGDGYDDMVVGATGAGASNEGKAYLFFGGIDGDVTPDLSLTGEAADDDFGYSASGIGDINNDGYDDFIVGAWLNDGVAGSAGRVYVYFGGSTPDGVPDLVFSGDASGDGFGFSVDAAGDVNGDGIDDFLVGALWDAGSIGTVRVYFGSVSPDTIPDLTLVGGGINGDLVGSSVAAGDINGDGFSDIIVGAEGDDTGALDAGSVYVYFGGGAPDSVADLVLVGQNDFDRFGTVSSADVNEDGYGDVLVGARFNDSVAENAGRAYVYFGGLSPDNVADIILNGEAADDRFGSSISGVGLWNTCGAFIVGATRNDTSNPDAGRAYIYSSYAYRVLFPNGGERLMAGAPATVRWMGPDVADLDLSTDGGRTWSTLQTGVGGNSTNQISILLPSVSTDDALVRFTYTGQSPTHANSDASDRVFAIVNPVRAPVAHSLRFSATGENPDDRFGNAVAGAGDVNGDGFEDLIVGAQNNDAMGSNAGRAYVFFGGPNSDDAPDLTLTGEALGDGFGGSVAGAGDVNGDGYDDFLVGAALNDAGANLAGRVYLYYGGPGVDSIADLIYMATSANYRLGYSVAGAGDINDDGYADVLAGGNFAGVGNEGKVNLYYGGANPDTTADLVISGEDYLDQMGTSLVGGIDLNSDGATDFVVSARGNEAGGSDRGRAYVFFGGPGLDGTPDKIINGVVNAENLGYRLAGGDVNGDGIDDLVVSAFAFNPGGSPDQGRVLIYYGGVDFNTGPDLILNGEAASDRFGTGLAVGDLTGDGIGDVVVGAYQPDLGSGAKPGRSYVFHGGPALDNVPDLTLNGAADEDWFGISVATGDLDGDGFSDLFVGADDGGTGGAEPGRIFVYDCNRYIVQSPIGGDTWNVGAAEGIEWLGAEPADLWLSTDGGSSYSLLASAVGGSESNVHGLTVPHQPTRFAKIKVTPTDSGVNGAATSDSLFTIEASISVLMLSAQPGMGGGVLLSWNTDPGPEDLAGYKIERSRSGDSWQILETLTRETSYRDAGGGPGMRYRLTAINGLGQEFELGETMLTPRAALSAWPLPYRGGDLSISFATYGGRGGGLGAAEVGIFDLSGRLVKTIARGDYAAGVQTVSWDGRDASGRNVASGVYFLRSVSAGENAQSRLVVVR